MNWKAFQTLETTEIGDQVMIHQFITKFKTDNWNKSGILNDLKQKLNKLQMKRLN